MSTVASIVLLLAAAMAVALVARRFGVPYTVALVLCGLLLGATHILPTPHLTQELLYAVFLPGLIFEAAFHISLDHLRRNKRTILLLAFPGVLLAITLTAGLLLAAPGGWFSSDAWIVPLAFASLITATDPIAVVGLFKVLGAPRRLAVIVEGESLLNDGVAVVVYTLAMLLATGGKVTLFHASIHFARVVGLGVVVGAALGFAVSKVIQRVEDPLIEITLTTVAAYGSFVAAEQLHCSGVLATVAAGIVCGSFGAPRGMSETTRVAVDSFWAYVGFALNSLVFLLIGLEVSVGELLAYWQPIVVAFVVVSIARGAVVLVVSAATRGSSERLPWRWGVVLTWSGLRGALSMVLALALPPEFPERDLVIATAFGVVILSIVVNGLTSGPLLRRLGLAGSTGLADERGPASATGKNLVDAAMP